MDPRNHALDDVQDRTNPFAGTRGDKTAMRLFAKLLWTLTCIQFLLRIHYCTPYLRGAVAQRVKRWTYDRQVVGSNPTRG